MRGTLTVAEQWLPSPSAGVILSGPNFSLCVHLLKPPWVAHSSHQQACIGSPAAASSGNRALNCRDPMLAVTMRC